MNLQDLRIISSCSQLKSGWSIRNAAINRLLRVHLTKIIKIMQFLSLFAFLHRFFSMVFVDMIP